MYHDRLGWLQRDPIGYADGMSLYEYVGSNPAGLRDAMGLLTLLPGGHGRDFWGDDAGGNTEKSSVDKIMDDIESGKIGSRGELDGRAESLTPEQQQELRDRLRRKYDDPTGGELRSAWSEWQRWLDKGQYSKPEIELRGFELALRQVQLRRQLYERYLGEGSYDEYLRRKSQPTFAEVLANQLNLHAEATVANMAQAVTLGQSETVNRWRDDVWRKSPVGGTRIETASTWIARGSTGTAVAAMGAAAAPVVAPAIKGAALKAGYAAATSPILAPAAEFLVGVGEGYTPGAPPRSRGGFHGAGLLAGQTLEDVTLPAATAVGGFIFGGE